jgi:DNA repair protein RecN (Recombination protein N)
MLKRLSIRGLSLLSDVTLEFGPGLNVITGETGAGKSLLLAALTALMGRVRPLATLARPGTEAVLEVLIHDREGAVEPRAIELVLRGNRATARIDGQGVPLARLRESVAERLLITTQGAARELASPLAVEALLDARAKNRDVLKAYRARRASCLELDAELERLRAEVALRAHKTERVTSLLAAVESLAPRAGEHSELARRIELVSERQHYLELCARIDREVSAADEPLERQIGQLLSAVRRAPSHPAFDELALDLNAALVALEAANRKAARIAAELDTDPAELGELEARRDSFERLAAQLGCRPDEVATASVELEAERARLETLESDLPTLTQRALSERSAALELGERLHQRRVAAVGGLAEGLRRELRALCLEHAELELVLERRAEALPPSGPSSLVLRFSANPGQPLQPLERVASGGERSRFVLALSCLGAASGRTLVFDEIDQGVGGEALARFSERLVDLGRSQQVICVTHQATIAAHAAVHFRVEKRVRDDSTRTIVTRLDEDARTAELSRMLAGGRALAGARALARRLLAEARSAA